MIQAEHDSHDDEHKRPDRLVRVDGQRTQDDDGQCHESQAQITCARAPQTDVVIVSDLRFEGAGMALDVFRAMHQRWGQGVAAGAVDLVDDTHLERGFSVLVICLSFVCDGESYSGGGGRSSRLDAAHAFISGGGDEGLEVSEGQNKVFVSSHKDKRKANCRGDH